MGLNISGILIDKNIEKSIYLLEGALKFKLVQLDKITFDRALDSKSNSDFIDIFFSEKGTLVFWGIPTFSINLNELSRNSTQILDFKLGENSMTFLFNHYKNGYNDWEYNIYFDEKENKMVQNGDNILSYSDNEDVIYDVFGRECQNYLNISFKDISMDTLFTRFKIDRSQEYKFGHLQIETILENFRKVAFSKKERQLALVSSNQTGEHVSFEMFLQNSGYNKNEIEELCNIVGSKKHWWTNSDTPPKLDKTSSFFVFSAFALFFAIVFGVYYIISLIIKPVFNIDIMNWYLALRIIGLIIVILVVIIVLKTVLAKNKRNIMTIYNSGEK